MTYDIFKSIKELKEVIGEESVWCEKKIEIGYSLDPIIEGKQSEIVSFCFVGNKPSKIVRKTSVVKQRLSGYGESKVKFVSNEFSLMVTVKNKIYALVKIQDAVEKYSIAIAYTYSVPKLNKILNIHVIDAIKEERLNFKMINYEKKIVEVKDVVQFNDNIFVIKTLTDKIFLIKKI